MIILSGVLVVLAIVLLVTGIVTGNTGHEIAGLDGLKLIYVSIGVSIVSALFLAIGVFLRRKELFGSATSRTSSKKASTTAVTAGKAARPTKAKARVGAGDETLIVPITSASATDVPAETTVYVVPGRKRYHLDTCRQLAGRDREELTFVEAREEGFTACTACLPDTALAARAALADTETSEQQPAVTPAESGLDEPVERARITHTDLPIPSRESATEELEAPEPTTSEIIDHTGFADVDDHADLAEHTETTEPVTEEPARRSWSLFEPLRGTSEEPEDHPLDDHEPTTVDEPEASADAELHEAADEPEPAPAPEDTAAEPEPESEADEDHEPADTETPTRDTEPTDDDDLAPTSEIADEPATEADASDAADQPSSLSIVRILSGTKRYHRTDCALIEDIAEDADDLETVTPAEAIERGCTPCLVCQPDKDHTSDDF